MEKTIEAELKRIGMILVEENAKLDSTDLEMIIEELETITNTVFEKEFSKQK